MNETRRALLLWLCVAAVLAVDVWLWLTFWRAVAWWLP